MRNKKRRSRRKLRYFLVALLSTFLIGAAVLIFYAHFMQENTPVMREKAEIIRTDTERKEILTETQADGQINTQTEMQTDGQTDTQTEIQTDDEIDVPTENRMENPANVQSANEKMAESGEQNETVTLAFGGDICFHDAYANMYALSNRGGKIESCISEELLTEMRQADICMVNNEFPYSDRGTPVPEKAFTFRSRPENVKLLQEMGVDVVSLANNHTYDHGEEAFLDTLTTLEGAGVDYVGAGRNLEEASRAVYYSINGVTIGILSATQIERVENPDTRGATENNPGVLRCFTEKELNYFLDMVAATRKQCDVLIVYIHWGTENTEETDWAQPYQAELISKAGADLIVGAHPHCLQGIGMVNDVPVIYSLGNYWFNSKTMDTALLKVTVRGKQLEAVQIIPARQQDCSTTILKDGDKQRVLEYLQSLSPGVEIDGEGFVKW